MSKRFLTYDQVRVKVGGGNPPGPYLNRFVTKVGLNTYFGTTWLDTTPLSKYSDKQFVVDDDIVRLPQIQTVFNLGSSYNDTVGSYNVSTIQVTRNGIDYRFGDSSELSALKISSVVNYTKDVSYYCVLSLNEFYPSSRKLITAFYINGIEYGFALENDGLGTIIPLVLQVPIPNYGKRIEDANYHTLRAKIMGPIFTMYVDDQILYQSTDTKLVEFKSHFSIGANNTYSSCRMDINEWKLSALV